MFTNYNFCKILLPVFWRKLRNFDHISPILNELGWLTIEELLNLGDVSMIYKCINGLAPNYLSSKLYKRSDTHAYNTRLKEHFSLPLCRTSIAQRKFYYRALKSWNKLFVATRNSSSLAQFKRRARGEMHSAGKWFLFNVYNYLWYATIEFL